MAVHRPVATAGIYFITFTCYRWMHLLAKTNGYDAVYKFFSLLNQNDHQVLGYTLMPNHVHLLLFFQHNKQSLNTVIGNGKRFIGYELVKRLQAQYDLPTLSLLEQGVTATEKKRGKLHQLWQGSFDVKPCRTEKFILQKLNYLHANPCVDRWQLCKYPYEYPHSSAAFYEMNDRSNLFLKDYRDYLAVLLELEEKERGSDNR
jgi:REP element-mobilizing transposase RayT